MTVSRKKLIEFHAETDHEQVDEMLASLMNTAEALKKVACFMEAAQVRIMASACAAHQQGCKFDGKKVVRLDEGVSQA